jgi:prepilin-type N-terminal cleavage/methylation domain-containing protein
MHRELIDNTWYRKKTKGFTLTETIVASALLVIAIVPILKGLTNAHFHSVNIERKTYSLSFAQAKLNEIRARSIHHYDNSFAESDASLDGSYLCNVADDSGDPLRTITVSVGYDINSNNNLTADEVLVTLSTYVARR